MRPPMRTRPQRRFQRPGLVAWPRRDSGSKRQNWLQSAQRSDAVQRVAMAQHEDVADDFGLLLQPVSFERFSGHERISILAEGMAHQRQIESAAPLALPDMREFVDEKSLPPQRLGREIFRPQIAVRMEVDVAGRRHRGVPGMQGPPFAAHHFHAGVIDRVAEDGAGKRDLALRE